MRGSPAPRRDPLLALPQNALYSQDAQMPPRATDPHDGPCLSQHLFYDLRGYDDS